MLAIEFGAEHIEIIVTVTKIFDLSPTPMTPLNSLSEPYKVIANPWENALKSMV